MVSSLLLTGQANFNPRTRAGCDIQQDVESWVFLRFQSTHPCRVRLSSISSADQSFSISIHAPVQGATFGNGRVLVGVDISIHAPVQGAT